MDYENDLELCEYNPIIIQYEKDFRKLSEFIQTPAKSFFQRLIERILHSHTLEVQH